jgi:hypothetical protein
LLNGTEEVDAVGGGHGVRIAVGQRVPGRFGQAEGAGLLQLARKGQYWELAQ